VAVLSGGNIDPLLLSKVVRHGLVAAGRFMSLQVRIPDRPGELARLLGVLGDSGANVLDVEHSRTGAGLHVDEVSVGCSSRRAGARTATRSSRTCPGQATR
jgi:threonine dehydratase